MFIAIRDLRYARGRFALLGGVIALMTLMVVLLTGLTAGLGAASVSAVAALPIDAIAFQRPADGQDVAFATSSLPAGAAKVVATQPGVGTAYPLGISTARVRHDVSSTAVTLMGADPVLYPSQEGGSDPGEGEVAVTADLAADQGLAAGDTIEVGGAAVRVTAIVTSTSFNHLPVVYTPIATWQRLAHTEGITAVGLLAEHGSWDAVDAAAGTRTVGRSDAYAAVGGYASEQGSLDLMRALLLGISALVVGAFFTVWTMQRGPDLAVVRALGGSRGYLLRDALGQAVLVLSGGSMVGAAIAAGTGALASRAMPIVLDAATVGLPLAGMFVVGLLGAAFSVRRVSAVEPITALGAAR